MTRFPQTFVFRRTVHAAFGISAIVAGFAYVFALYYGPDTVGPESVVVLFVAFGAGTFYVAAALLLREVVLTGGNLVMKPVGVAIPLAAIRSVRHVHRRRGKVNAVVVATSLGRPIWVPGFLVHGNGTGKFILAGGNGDEFLAMLESRIGREDAQHPQGTVPGPAAGAGPGLRPRGRRNRAASGTAPAPPQGDRM